MPTSTTSGSPARTPSALWSVAALAFVSAIVIAIRWHRLEVPLERDEGEYAYAAQLMLDGVPPYSGAYNMKLPGIYAVYTALLATFGSTVTGIRIGLLVANLATILGIFLIGKHVLGSRAGLSAALVFGVASLDPSVTGLFANSEHFVLVPVVFGTFALLAARTTSSFLAHLGVGALFGLAFVVKQHALAFVAFGALVTLLAARRSPRRVVAFAVGAVLPFAAVCAWMAVAGVFGRFWFWTFTYAATYVGQVGVSEGLRNLVTQLENLAWPLGPLWALAALGALAVLRRPALRPQAAWLLAFAVFSFGATCPGLHFRDHYFVLALPAASLLAGFGIAGLQEALASRGGTNLARLAAIGALLATCALPLVWRWPHYVTYPDPGVARATFGPNPFPEAEEIGKRIRERSRPEDRIAVIGSEPQIYFYADRRAATGHIYTYALMEEHAFALEMQQEMIAQIEAAKPAWIVFVNVPTSWLERKSSHRRILEWASGYLQSHYVLTALYDIVAPDRTDRFWDAEVVGRRPRSPNQLGVFRRKGT